MTKGLSTHRDVRAEFGLRLRQLRTEAGYSQESLADLAGLHRTYVGSVERGERNVSLEGIWSLALALDTSPAAFFETGRSRWA